MFTIPFHTWTLPHQVLSAENMPQDQSHVSLWLWVSLDPHERRAGWFNRSSNICGCTSLIHVGRICHQSLSHSHRGCTSKHQKHTLLWMWAVFPLLNFSSHFISSSPSSLLPSSPLSLAPSFFSLSSILLPHLSPSLPSSHPPSPSLFPLLFPPGVITRTLRTIYVSREDSSSRMKAVQEIRRRAQSRGEWPKVLIFPEGTTTHTQQAVFLELAVLAAQLCERLLLASNSWETMPLFLAWELFILTVSDFLQGCETKC